jgi:hypothetical protein
MTGVRSASDIGPNSVFDQKYTVRPNGGHPLRSCEIHCTMVAHLSFFCPSVSAICLFANRSLEVFPLSASVSLLLSAIQHVANGSSSEKLFSVAFSRLHLRLAAESIRCVNFAVEFRRYKGNGLSFKVEMVLPAVYFNAFYYGCHNGKSPFL